MTEDAQNKPTSDILKAIYDQDCQFNRHRQDLQWTRFNTTVLIEGGALFGAFMAHGLSAMDRIGLWIFATTLVATISLLAIADAVDSASHLDRIRIYEAGWPFKARAWKWAKWIIVSALICTTAFNLIVLGRLAGGASAGL